MAAPRGGLSETRQVKQHVLVGSSKSLGFEARRAHFVRTPMALTPAQLAELKAALSTQRGPYKLRAGVRDKLVAFFAAYDRTAAELPLKISTFGQRACIPPRWTSNAFRLSLSWLILPAGAFRTTHYCFVGLIISRGTIATASTVTKLSSTT